MKIRRSDAITTVTLSERNVLELYHQLERLTDGRGRAIGLTKWFEDGMALYVTIEADYDHYGEGLAAAQAYNYGRA